MKYKRFISALVVTSIFAIPLISCSSSNDSSDKEGNSTLTSKPTTEEDKRINNTVELIASENFPSAAIRMAMASSFTCKYAEGYPGRRYYGGCSAVDGLETYCQQKWQEVFNTDYHVNVQPHSGTNANLAAYMAVLQHGDRVLSMALESGGCDKMASLVW